MQAYRVLLQDKQNGESFTFAVTVLAESEHWAAATALEEFPDSGMISVMRTFHTLWIWS